jgi:hypothetical protein
MEGFQEKEDSAARRPDGVGKKNRDRDNDGKAQIRDAMEQFSGRQGDSRFHRKRRGGDRDNKGSQTPDAEAPISFNAHPLDMEPDTIVPERPNIDLTYIDFTRESVEEGDRHSTPKKKKNIPYELSETPHMDPEYWEGRTPGRRKLMSKADAAVSVESVEETSPPPAPRQSAPRKESAEKVGAKQDSHQKAQKGRPERKVSKESVRENRANNEAGVNVKHQDSRGAKGKGRQNASAQDTIAALSDEPAKESLMKPYWLKK